jgi:hypothetical protein
MSYCFANISLLVALLLLSSTAVTSTSAFFTGVLATAYKQMRQQCFSLAVAAAEVLSQQ